jgi:amidohydrolase
MKYNKTRLKELRHRLHKFPELSGKEHKTAKLVKQNLLKFEPDNFIGNLGGTGIAAIFSGEKPGPSILFRCELDALPIQESNTFRYTSSYPGVSHACGHDGHMTIMMGFAEAIHNNPPSKGRIILLFQPSEENGQGAIKVLNDEQFKSISPDYVFALHNLPGYPAGSVILREGAFAAASKGMINRLFGKTSHAGEPENGISPALAMTDIIRKLTYLPQNNTFEDFTMVTIIHSRLGEVAFGTTPGYAEVMATLRSYSNRDMDIIADEAIKLVRRIASENQLNIETSWTEEFPATINQKEALNIVRRSAQMSGLKTIFNQYPFRWSEDFSNFTLKYPGALFGLGSGEDHPQLHNPDYDFPEEIIDKGIEMFYGIYRYFQK